MMYDEFVSRVKILDIKINQQLLEAERLKSLCEQVTTIWLSDIKVQSAAENTREKRLAELIDNKRLLEDLLEQRDSAKQEIIKFLNTSLKIEDADVLTLKYIYGKTISQIADMKCYTYSGAANKINRAEKRARKIYSDSIQSAAAVRRKK